RGALKSNHCAATGVDSAIRTAAATPEARIAREVMSRALIDGLRAGLYTVRHEEQIYCTARGARRAVGVVCRPGSAKSRADARTCRHSRGAAGTLAERRRQEAPD